MREGKTHMFCIICLEEGQTPSSWSCDNCPETSYCEAARARFRPMACPLCRGRLHRYARHLPADLADDIRREWPSNSMVMDQGEEHLVPAHIPACCCCIPGMCFLVFTGDPADSFARRWYGECAQHMHGLFGCWVVWSFWYCH
jgi:hypothetical protein